LELRAALSLGRLWAIRGELQRAQELLAPITPNTQKDSIPRTSRTQRRSCRKPNTDTGATAKRPLLALLRHGELLTRRPLSTGKPTRSGRRRPSAVDPEQTRHGIVAGLKFRRPLRRKLPEQLAMERRLAAILAADDREPT
jgi:hypothetical protein